MSLAIQRPEGWIFPPESVRRKFSNFLGEGSERGGFSLLEMLAATAVFILLVGVVLKMTQATADSWSSSTGKTEGVRDARAAFATITKAVSQATLNPYFDYADSSGNFRDAAAGTFTPARYLRRSDLHFIAGRDLLSATIQNSVGHAVFFQAPLGYTRSATYADMEGFLNACGFYVFYGPDPALPSHLDGVVPSPNRFRLMQFLQPSENLAIFDSSVTGGKTNWSNKTWFTGPLGASGPPASQLAENVVALVVNPKMSENDEISAGSPLTADFDYDSRDAASVSTHNQLPPVVEIILVVIDEKSASRLPVGASPPELGQASLFQETDKIESDLAELEKNLSAQPGNAAGNAIPLRYQIFRTEVSLRGSKWSAQQ
jgi:uncharacterized protein (TIGR02599 family)